MRNYLLAALCLCLVGCPTDIKEALRQYGYMPVRPASSMWRPGAVVYIKNRDPLEVGFICTASQMMGKDYAPLESMTTNADLARASKKGITMAAQVQDIVSADSELSDIRSVKMLLRNVKVFETTDMDVINAAQKPNRRCLRAIAMRRAQGFDVTFISGAIQADVSYTINWMRESKLSVQAKVAAAQNLSAKLGVDASSTSDKAIQATGLVWGIRADDYLGWLFFDTSNSPAPDRGSKILDPNVVAAYEVQARGIESRSMPTTPIAENAPLQWPSLPPIDGPAAPVAEQDPNVASVVVDANETVVHAVPVDCSTLPVDVPIGSDATPDDPNAAPLPDAEVPVAQQAAEQLVPIEDDEPVAPLPRPTGRRRNPNANRNSFAF